MFRTFNADLRTVNCEVPVCFSLLGDLLLMPGFFFSYLAYIRVCIRDFPGTCLIHADNAIVNAMQTRSDRPLPYDYPMKCRTSSSGLLQSTRILLGFGKATRRPSTPRCWHFNHGQSWPPSSHS